jgi:hypothetical protein
MVNFWVEMKCQEHGLERFKIKIVKKFNVRSDSITPKFRSRPTAGDLSCLLVGRDVDYIRMERFLREYYRQKGLEESILTVRLKV